MKLKINKNLVKRGIYFSGLTLMCLNVTGCLYEEQADIVETESIIDTNNEDGMVEPIINQVEVPGENFKLEVEYNCLGLEDSKWRITSDKKIQMRVCTNGLPADTKVWIDNIHIDTTIVATKKEMDGIIQDSMDDRIHNSLMIGFPISDTANYYGINIIEGQNDSFIHGSYMGMNGISSGSVDEHRYLESDYLERGVYANHMAVVYGILVQGPNDLEPRGIDVYDDVYIKVCDTIDFKDEYENIKNIKYNLDGSSEEVTAKQKVKK